MSSPFKRVGVALGAPKSPSGASVRPVGQKLGRISGQFAHLRVGLIQGCKAVLSSAPGRLYKWRTTVTKGRSSTAAVVNLPRPGQPGSPAPQNGGLFFRKDHRRIEEEKAVKMLPFSSSNSPRLLRTALIRCRSRGEPLSADPLLAPAQRGKCPWNGVLQEDSTLKT